MGQEAWGVFALMGQLGDDEYYSVLCALLTGFLEECVAPENREKALRLIGNSAMAVCGEPEGELRQIMIEGRHFDYVELIRKLEEPETGLQCECRDGKFGHGKR
jgi:hypothetical protein